MSASVLGMEVKGFLTPQNPIFAVGQSRGRENGLIFGFKEEFR